MRKITEIIVHCTATPEGKDFTVEDIRRWHKEQGFSDVGYHVIVYRDGSIHPGRPLDQVGAHCRGHNAQSIGVCYVGGLDSTGVKPKDTRTQAQRTALRQVVSLFEALFPKAHTYGHNNFAAKACPCFNVKTEM